MTSTTEPVQVGLGPNPAARELASQWRSLTRAATAVAIFTSPAAFLWFYVHHDWSLFASLLVTFIAVIAFRGLVDVVLRRFIPWPSLFGADDMRARDEDVLARRRAWYWRKRYRLFAWFLVFLIPIWLIRGGTPLDTIEWFFGGIWAAIQDPSIWTYAVIFPILFLFNFLILFGPLMLMGVTQVQGFEPGDAEWGVKLDDVRGQAEAKEEVRRVVSLWQSGEAFERAGGKRERGLLFLGAPGTGKTMLSKAIATGFNCFAPEVEYMTKQGFKTFEETGGTTQTILNSAGEWVDAEIRSFGKQRLVELELRPGRHTRSSVRLTVRATPDHRWVTENRGVVTDVREGDFLPFQGAPGNDRIPEAFIRGFGFGDGTLDARGRARIRLCGERDQRFLSLFQEFGHCFVTYPPSFGGDPLVIFNGGHMSDWKEPPSGDEDPAWLASWLEGYLAADGWEDGSGASVLETQDADAVALVKRIAPYAGYMVVGNHTKSNTATNYGPRSAPLTALKLRREGVWRVISLREAGESNVYCAVEPKTQTFTLAGGVLTGNCPFVSIPGSGFQQTFIGMDAVVVRWLAWKAKRLARKWGGQCIVFIDEIDAVGMRRHSLGPGGGAGGISGPVSFEDFCFYGRFGALNQTEDLILETRAWRDRLFAERAPERHSPYPPFVHKLGGIVNQAMPGMFGGGGGLALNQLLVVMDGIGNPPFMRRMFVNRFNTFLDATYVIPRKIGRMSLRLPAAKPAAEQIYFIGACNVPIEQLDPALIRPGRMGRHVWFRTPTKKDRLDIFDLYINKVSHESDLDRPERRDELARITMGYSPAMIEQVCSMALTHAHHDGREQFGWEDIVEAMTTVESGTAINIEYIPEETRAVAIHEAGHAVAAHVYMKDAESTRISIRRRGSSLGHHMALDKDERFTRWRSEQAANLVWTLGAMAAEQVFYGENSDGVGGDVSSATTRAAFMVGASAMGPEPIDLDGAKFADETPDQTRERIMERFEAIGNQIMNRTGGGGPFSQDPIGSVLSDRYKRATAARLLGQAYVHAYNLMALNKDKVEKIAEQVIARREIYGDELLDLLKKADLKRPTLDYTDEKIWPTM